MLVMHGECCCVTVFLIRVSYGCLGNKCLLHLCDLVFFPSWKIIQKALQSLLTMLRPEREGNVYIECIYAYFWQYVWHYIEYAGSEQTNGKERQNHFGAGLPGEASLLWHRVCSCHRDNNLTPSSRKSVNPCLVDRSGKHRLRRCLSISYKCLTGLTLVTEKAMTWMSVSWSSNQCWLFMFRHREWHLCL